MKRLLNAWWFSGVCQNWCLKKNTVGSWVTAKCDRKSIYQKRLATEITRIIKNRRVVSCCEMGIVKRCNIFLANHTCLQLAKETMGKCAGLQGSYITMISLVSCPKSEGGYTVCTVWQPAETLHFIKLSVLQLTHICSTYVYILFVLFAAVWCSYMGDTKSYYARLAVREKQNCTSPRPHPPVPQRMPLDLVGGCRWKGILFTGAMLDCNIL